LLQSHAAVVTDLTPSNVAELLGGADLILDGTDNLETRYLINDFAVSRGVPWLYGAAVGSYGLTKPVIPGRMERPIDLVALKARLEPLGEVRANEFALRFFAAPYEMTVFPDGRAIIKGTSDTGVARSLYARYVG
jgi:hypothetical protein